MQLRLTTTSDRWAAELRVRDLLLYALAVVSGSVDAISFLTLGKVFAAFMTGNIIFLGLRVAGVGEPGKVSIVVSLASFAMGVYIATRLIGPSEQSRMWPQRVTVVLGLSLIAHAVFLTTWFAKNGQALTDVAHVLLGSWALAMGMQTEAVRTFHIDDVFTTAATGTFVSFVRAFSNRFTPIAETRRRAGVLVSLSSGATGGGLLLGHAHVLAPVLPVVITLLVVITAAIAFRERDVQDEQGRRRVA